MQNKLLLITLFLLLALNPIFAQISIDGYTTHEVHGFSVLMNDDAVSNHAVQMQSALNELSFQLESISKLDMRSEDLNTLRSVKIFVEWENTNGAAVYHPSEQWLIENGYIPEKAQSVEITNAVNFVNWSKQNQPWMVLHELTHAYHHQVLTYSNQRLIEVYENARDSGIYNSVDYNPGNGQPYFKQKAYAMDNDTEYFSEITEAYFGENDYYPFNREQLESHDSLGYSLLVDVWGIDNVTNIFVQDEEMPNEYRLSQNYPNPFNPVTTIKYTIPTNVQSGTSNVNLIVYDILGSEIAALVNESKMPGNYEITWDASSNPSGIYFYKLAADNYIETKKMLLMK